MPEFMKFDTLYKKASGGAIQEWTIHTEDNIIVTRWGQRGGAVQETRDEVKSGKNVGKKNETSPTQQAQLEAAAKFEKQLKKGYVRTLDDAAAGKVDAIIEGGVSPMLAHRFDEQGHKIQYPAFAQPKFDGHRCIAVIEDGKVTLWSRTRKPITGLPHIVKAIENWAKIVRRANLVLDGELYNHDYREKFEELTSFIRNPEPKPGHEAVQYHIYDVAMNDATFADRHSLLGAFSFQSPHLIAVETIAVSDEDELMTAFERFLAQGYEGLMVRNTAGKYVNKRSYDLQKVKEFASSEFEVIGVEEGRGKLAGHAIFVCKTEGGQEFRAKMKGETSKLKEFFDRPETAIGRQLEVKYQGFTNTNGVPRFPVALRFRDDL